MSHHESVTHITEDIVQVRLPLPFALNIVNVYLLRGDAGWTIVDTGLNTAAARETWQAAFDTLKIGPADIEKIVLTHTHPDHFGMAGWLQKIAREAGREIPVYASPKEDEQACFIWREEGDFNIQSWVHTNGAPPEMAQEIQGSANDTRSKTHPLPLPLRHHQPGEPIQLGARTFQTIHAPGHSDGQLIFYDPADQLMISGDHVLMKITPNIGKWVYTLEDPLGLFLDSLGELHHLDVRLALPGHKRLITDWQGRIEELIAHHELRLKHVLEVLEQGKLTPYEVAGRIFPVERFSIHEWRFAVAESLAHLEYLALRGRIHQAPDARLFSLI